MYLSNSQGLVCQVGVDDRLSLLSGCNNFIPLVVHESSKKYASDIHGRSSVLCNFSTMGSKNNYLMSWITTTFQNSDNIILVWYPQIDNKGRNCLVEELNSCISPSYLCHHIYGWYVSDNVEEATIWKMSHSDKKGAYKLIDANDKTTLYLEPLH